MPSTIEIYDPKKRNEIVQSFLKNRKEHKFKNLEERSNLENVEDHRIEVFKPILESNKKLQEEIIDEKNKIVQTLNSFKGEIKGQPQILQSTPMKQIQSASSPSKVNSPSNEPKVLGFSESVIKVSNLIATYLQDPRDKSNAGYSIRYSSEEGLKGYTIGNKEVVFDDNTMEINNSVYIATPGLMELLTKKSPDISKIQKEDTQNYRDILLCSNALYQGFDKSSKRYNADASDKWKFIKENYFVTKEKSSQGSSKLTQSPNVSKSQSQGSSISQVFDFLPEDINALMDSLRLSIGSYQADYLNKNIRNFETPESYKNRDTKGRFQSYSNQSNQKEYDDFESKIPKSGGLKSFLFRK
uniref:DUF8207 domain-containing protein n=1 Tax=Heterorhabditis bacteriophora TaxID=37862 RepID=A0A1I7X5Y2_HETBA